MILAGDIGGTNTRLGLFTPERGPDAPVAEQKYRSKEYAGLEEIIISFLSDQQVMVDKASIGVAGPLKKNRASITNLSWVIDGDKLCHETGIANVSLLNDLEAMAYAIPHLDTSMIETINSGVAVSESNKALIAPGTGLGEVFLTWNGTGYQPHSSEGGHTEFGPRNDLQMDLLSYMLKRYDHVSYEWVCSGIGIPNLYSFFKDTGRYPEPPALGRALAEEEDRTPLIVNAALDAPDKHPICVAVLELFTSILGAQAGNLAMTVSSFGGMYVGGGLPPRIGDYIRSPLFLDAFKNKGRLSPMVEDMPIYLITHPNTALLGAASHALGM
ncbi:glucokinase [Desulforhopalus sp. 52FAK]